MQSKLLEGELENVLEGFWRLLRQMPTTGDLSLTAAAAMTRLERDGPQRLTDLAALEGQSQPAMTQLVTRLEHAGLVRRAPGPGDRRVVMVEVSGAGLALLKRRRRERAGALRGLLLRLDKNDRAAVAEALPALRRLVELGLQGGAGIPVVTPAAAPVARARATA